MSRATFHFAISGLLFVHCACGDGDESGGGSTANRPPVALGGTASAQEDGPAINGHVPAATDADGDLDSTGYTLATNVAEGTLTFSPDGSYTFDPGLDFQSLRASAKHVVYFEYTASDMQGATSELARVSITVDGTNDPPQLVVELADQTAKVGVAFSSALPAGTFVDVDEGDSMTLSVGGLPLGLSFAPVPGNISGEPKTSGDNPVTVTATDTSNGSASDTFNLRVWSGAGKESYAYDEAGRLRSVTFADGSVVSYTYDMAGNVLNRSLEAQK